MNDTAIIKLISGEEIICILLNDLDSSIVKVKYPFQIRYSSQNEVYMIPLCLLTDEIYYEFKRDQILFCVNPTEQVTVNYLNTINQTEVISITSTNPSILVKGSINKQ